MEVFFSSLFPLSPIVTGTSHCNGSSHFLHGCTQHPFQSLTPCVYAIIHYHHTYNLECFITSCGTEAGWISSIIQKMAPELAIMGRARKIPMKMCIFHFIHNKEQFYTLSLKTSWENLVLHICTMLWCQRIYVRGMITARHCQEGLKRGTPVW